MNKTIKYAEYRKTANTFDILNFENKDWLWRMIGHTAMVVVDKQYDLVQCFESTSKGLGGQSGVQINPLKARLETCNSRVFVRQAIFLDKHLYYNAVAKNKEFIISERHKPYPPVNKWTGKIYLAKAAVDGLPLSENVENPNWRFCTDLVAADYRYCELARYDGASSEFEPDDMRSNKTNLEGEKYGEFDYWLVDGVTLGDEMEITL